MPLLVARNQRDLEEVTKTKCNNSLLQATEATSDHYFVTVEVLIFFTPIPCTYTSLLLDGMARNYYFNLHGYARSCNLSCLDPFHSYLLYPRRRKNIWSELESNSGHLASQVTALTTRPWLLGSVDVLIMFVVCSWIVVASDANYL